MMKTNRLTAVVGITVVTLVGCSSGSGGGNGGKNDEPPANSSPSAIITVDAATGEAPFTVNFDASQSTDSDGSVASYSWDFGDGNNAQTSQVSHTYSDFDIYTATLTVTDDDGATASSTVTVTVHARVAGYYYGSMFSDQSLQRIEIELIVGPNLELYAWDYVDYDSAYWGDYDILVAMLSGTLRAEIWNPELTFADGTQFGSIAVSADVVPRQSIRGTWSGVGDVGPIDVTYVPDISDAPLTLAEISGTWSYVDPDYSESMIISTTGALDYSSSDGCAATGQLSELDPAINIYQFEYDLSCPPGVINNPNGIRTGLAFVDNYWNADSWLIFAGAIGDSGSNLAVTRPRSATPVKAVGPPAAKATRYGPPRTRDRMIR